MASCTPRAFRSLNPQLRSFSTRPGEERDEDTGEAVIVPEDTGSSSTPFDDDYFAADTMPEGESEAILGLNEFTEALEFYH